MYVCTSKIHIYILLLIDKGIQKTRVQPKALLQTTPTCVHKMQWRTSPFSVGPTSRCAHTYMFALRSMFAFAFYISLRAFRYVSMYLDIAPGAKTKDKTEKKHKTRRRANAFRPGPIVRRTRRVVFWPPQLFRNRRPP